jgi:hypothetical protein
VGLDVNNFHRYLPLSFTVFVLYHYWICLSSVFFKIFAVFLNTRKIRN